MKTVQNFVQAGALVACAILFSVGAAPVEAEDLLEDRELVTGQQCRVDEHTPLRLVHGRPRHFYPHYPRYYPLPPYPPPVYPPSGSYYAPYPRGRYLSQPPPVLLPARCPASRRAVCLCGAVGRGGGSVVG